MPSQFRPRIFESDATDEQRQMYADVCGDLAFDPLAIEESDRGDIVVLAFRGTRDDRREIGKVARHLGVTQNALALTALRLGVSAISEARDERSGED